MKLLEEFTKGKKGKPDLSEDLYVFNSDFAAVIDGATNAADGITEGKSPGRIAAEAIREAVEKLHPESTLTEMLEHINQYMQKAHEIYQLKEAIEKDRWKAPTASMAIYSCFHREIWQIGDCQAMLDGKLIQNEKEIDTITAQARSMYLEAEISKGKTIEELLSDDTGWKFILPLIRQQHYLQNDSESQYGFEVINGFPVDQSKIKITFVPKSAEQLILASDGYPFLQNTLEKSESSLQALMEEDPLNFRKYKSAKGLIKGNLSFDDRTYLRILL